MTGSSPSLTIVVPCYNEEKVLPQTAMRLDRLLTRLVESGTIASDSHVLFVDDGSRDGTWAIVQELQGSPGRFGGIKLSRNFGHQNALMTGLLAARADVIISADADLQDDLDAIEEMLRAASQGADIVYGVRNARESDRLMKRLTARLYYRLLQFMSVEIVFDHADFRLMTRRAVEALRQYQESNLFLRALIPKLGFQTSIVTYKRSKRFAGTSKYSLHKMLALAIEGITSFSIKPLRIATILGFCISLFSLILTAWAMYVTVVLGNTVPGWASTVVPVYFIGGVQLICMGIMGEYIGKIYLETKRRPRSHIAEVLEPYQGSASSGVDNGERRDT